jgi:hypothetical protein
LHDAEYGQQQGKPNSAGFEELEDSSHSIRPVAMWVMVIKPGCSMELPLQWCQSKILSSQEE